MDNHAMNGHPGDRRDHNDQRPPGATSPRGTEPAPFARLKERAEFLAVAKGARMHEAAFTLQAAPREPVPDDGATARRFGLTVTKKTGNSVVRNRIRRRLREALRLSGVARGDMAAGGACDYVIVARRETLSRDFASLTHDIANSVKRIDKRLAGGPKGRKPST